MEYNRYYITHRLDSPAILFGGESAPLPRGESEGQVLPSLLVRPDGQELRDLLWRVFQEWPDKRFSVTIDMRNDQKDAAWLNLVCDLFCHPMYYRKNNKEVLNILCASSEGTMPAGLEEEWRSFFFSQGFAEVVINPIASGRSYFPARQDYHPTGRNYLVIDRGNEEDTAVLSDLAGQLIGSGKVDIDVFFVRPGEGRILSFGEAYERQLRQSPPDLVRALDQIRHLSLRVAALEEKDLDLSREVASLQAYNDFLLRLAYDPTGSGAPGSLQNEAVKIRNFYYTEYEILPMWYKRFGHIIKVLTGKRTFRSLFNDNVPKYKNLHEKN